MKNPTELGKNRTGIDMSPIDSKDVTTAAAATVPPTPDRAAFDDIRRAYIEEADPVGTVPVPGALKGIAKSTMKKAAGKRPEVFIDKLGQRLQFERTGVRLYDAFILKCETLGMTEHLPNFSLDLLKEFRDEEFRHFAMVRDSMKKLGADPTAMTPAANVDAVASMGFVQALNDPRTSIDECLCVMLTAELADNDGWNTLIKMAATFGFDDLAADFRIAKTEEDRHLEHVRGWLNHFVIVSEAQAA